MDGEFAHTAINIRIKTKSYYNVPFFSHSTTYAMCKACYRACTIVGNHTERLEIDPLFITPNDSESHPEQDAKDGRTRCGSKSI